MPEEHEQVSDLTFRAAQNQLKDLADEIRRVGEKEVLTESDDTYLRELTDKFDEVEDHYKKLQRKALIERVDAATGNPLQVDRGYTPKNELDDDPFGEPDSIREGATFHNPWDLSEVRRLQSPEAERSEYRARALSAVEKMSGANDKRREAMTKLVEENSAIAKQALITSNPDYMRAFAKLIKNQGNMAYLEPKEQRAMSLTDTAGGFLIPFQLDPTVVISSDGSLNQIRRVARQVVATGDTWNPVTAGETSWSWDTEASEVSDDASTFAQPSINIHTARGFVPISLEAMEDEANVAAEVGRLLAFGKDTHEATAFATGTGSGQPFGIITALNTVSASIVTATTNNQFGLVDLYAVDEQLPARFRINGSYLANRSIYNDIRQFDTAGGAALWERLGGDVPGELLGRPAYEAEAMDGTIATGDDYVLVFGDFQHYVIADRIGTRVEFIPHLFSTGSGRPTGQRGWFAYYRVGADAIVNGAFRLLHV